MDKVHVKKLTRALFASGVLNISLVSLFFYWTIRERPPTPYFESKPAEEAAIVIDHSNLDMVRQFKELTTEQLISKLSSQELVENGYTQRDIALACLVTFHHFDINRALTGLRQPTQHRAIQFGARKDGSPAKVVAYPGLSDEQFKAITAFAASERWPQTSRGLFLRLKKTEGRADASLADAFYLTPEYLAVEMLFNRSTSAVDRQDLLNILSDGTWQMLSSFVGQQKEVQDLSPARRQHFLLQYIEKGSKAAAYVMLKTDGPVTVRKLDDMHVKAMLQLLTEKTKESEKFALVLLTSPRGDAVWHLAAQRLYGYAGETMPEKFQHHEALARFLNRKTLMRKSLPEQVASVTPKPPSPPVAAVRKEAPVATVRKEVPAKGDRLYIVQDGDSLWKISRRFKIDMEKIKSHNRLTSDALRPGTSLRIPA